MHASTLPDLTNLLQKAQGNLWRGRPDPVCQRAALSTGHARLDAALPDHGWPLGCVIELLLPRPMIGVLNLLLPAMHQLSQQSRWLALLNPPAIPYAPGLAQAGIDLNNLLYLPDLHGRMAWWAMQQLVTHPCCGLVIAWADPPDPGGLRRLQLAVECGGGLAMLCRNRQAERQPSTAALRLRINQDSSLDIVKARGAIHQQTIRLD